MPDVATELPLRERKKLRTRQALIDTALALFDERGFDRTTLADLCQGVEISKRTFFRTFASKEAVAMAPLQDMWSAFLDQLERGEPRPATLLEFLQEALVAAIETTATDGWAQRATRSHQLAQDTPSMAAHNLQFCDQTTRSALLVLHRQLELPDDLRPRLALDILVAAFHRALDTWTTRTTFETADLLADLNAAFAAIPGAVTLSARISR
ncbi:TetR/AcrR family transcriptional regulator [Nocardia goodfellowii]|uniref:AcrR family transcriptional regulator n=1 Tax=Nocardia goodfellowii TaxID=882446 RepID=A0ABS4QDW9_9NOCA|nr:TetR family transcriptional regulator [Nocardia goodfellowii]MBP2189891.1 AcrR family transcriptional regulator [Nocardia goodfellowii]